MSDRVSERVKSAREMWREKLQWKTLERVEE